MIRNNIIKKINENSYFVSDTFTFFVQILEYDHLINNLTIDYIWELPESLLEEEQLEEEQKQDILEPA